MVCAKPASEQAHPKLDVRNRATAHRGNDLGCQLRLLKRPVETQQRALQRNLLRAAKAMIGALNKGVQATRQIVLHSLAPVAKQLHGGARADTMTGEHMVAAAQTEEGLAG
jgi:hypothetical protein